ncbi:MAG: APC family permease [Thermoanaerobacterales bacterium]|nr:APC family permease [Thermoanaerobacterales bacterium]
MALKRVLSLRTVVATSAGIALASSSFLAAVQVASYLAGDTAWLAILAGGALCFLAAACFSELNGFLPSAAGVRVYFERTFGERPAITISLLYMGVVTAVLGAESFVLSHVLSSAVPQVPPLAWLVAMFIIIGALNIRGVKFAGNFQDLVTYALIPSLILMALLALSKVHFQLEAPLAPGSLGGFVNAMALGVFLYIGFEWVTPLAEEVTGIRTISKGMFIALGILSVTYALLTVAMTATVFRSALTAAPAPQMVFAQEALGPAGAAWMVVLSLAASIKTFNAGLISVSRFVYATAREGLLPKWFARVSMRYFTPWAAIVAIVLVGVVFSAYVLWAGDGVAKVIVGMAAGVECAVYALVGWAVLSLRKKMPDVERPFRVPGGVGIPLATTVVFGLLGAAVLTSDWRVAGALAASLLAVVAYVLFIVPPLKKRHLAERQARMADRPRRRPVQGR